VFEEYPQSIQTPTGRHPARTPAGFSIAKVAGMQTCWRALAAKSGRRAAEFLCELSVVGSLENHGGKLLNVVDESIEFVPSL
jgi:hypothetical protein